MIKMSYCRLIKKILFGMSLIFMLQSNLSLGHELSKESSEKSRVWNLQNADIRAVIEQVAKETGKNFIVDSKVKGNISIVSGGEINSEEVYQVFLSLLDVLGFTAIEDNKSVKIVPDSQGKHMGLPLSDPLQMQDMVVHVVPIKYVSALALVPVLRPLISPQAGHLSAYGPSNRLIIADRKHTVTRIVEIIERVDVDDSHEMEIITLKYAVPSEIVNVLNSLLNTRKPGEISTTQVVLSPDDRSSTIIMSGDKSRRLSIRAIIANLDVESPGTGNTEVIYVKYQKAEDLVKVIVNVIESYFGANKASQFSSSSPSLMDTMRVMTGESSESSLSSHGLSDTGSGLEADSRQSVGTVIGGFGVYAEPNINALIVTAPKALMRNVKAVIAQLDVRRPQVLVEAIVVEMEEKSGENLGIDWRLGGAGIGGYTSGNDVGSLSNLQSNIDSNKTKSFSPGLSVGILRGSSIRALLNALESSSANNILATPSIVALDNTKAKIFVGDKVPFKTGSSSLDGGVLTEQISREDVGLGLAIVPQITMDEAIVLAIDQKADTVVPASEGGDLLTRTTTNRSISTKVIVNNGDILVLGGLIRSQEDKTEIGIPILGRLPGIGRFFRTEKTSIAKRNLMVFLRPTIMRNQQDSIFVTTNKYNYMRDRMLLNAREDKASEDLRSGSALLPTLNNELANLPEPFSNYD